MDFYFCSPLFNIKISYESGNTFCHICNIYTLIPPRREENNPVDVSNAKIVIESITYDEKSKTYGLLEE